MRHRPDAHEGQAPRCGNWLVSRSLLSRGVAGSVFLGVLVACAFGVMLVAVSDLRRSTNVQAQSRDITSATLGLEQLVDQLEMSLRAYLVSGNERFQTAWQRARGHLPAAIDDDGEPALGPTGPGSARRSRSRP